MQFPQYLWRIGCQTRPLLLRRGHTPEEAIEKALLGSPAAQGRIIGILDYCDTGDAGYYSNNHPWDWFSE